MSVSKVLDFIYRTCFEWNASRVSNLRMLAVGWNGKTLIFYWTATQQRQQRQQRQQQRPQRQQQQQTKPKQLAATSLYAILPCCFRRRRVLPQV